MHKTLGHIVAILLNLAALSVEARVAWNAESDNTQATVVELFTSQGCSSCPPADAWLSTLKQRPDLFQRIVPVAYHVTYWDYLGWRDQFGIQANDTRHRETARRAGSGVYTPGMFVQGNEWRTWRRQNSDLRLPSAAEVGRLTARGIDERVAITFRPIQANNRPLKVHVAYLRSGETRVTAGENRGRSLTEDFIVGAVVAGDLREEAGVWRGEVSLSPPSEASAVAVWVVDQTHGAYLQATGTWL